MPINDHSCGDVPRDRVLHAAERICQSKSFRGSDYLSDLLTVLVECELEIRDEKPTASLIAQNVFGLGPDFRSKKDSRVRVAVKRLRTELELYNARNRPEVVIGLDPGNYKLRIGWNLTQSDDVENALQIANWYQGVATRQAHSVAYRRLANMSALQPEDPDVLAAFADLLLDGVKHGYQRDHGQVEKAGRLLEKAFSITPSNPRALLARAFLSLEDGDFDKVRNCGRSLIQSKDENWAIRGQWVLEVANGNQTSPEMEGSIPRQATEGVGWLHHNSFVRAYELGDYEQALIHANNFGMPGFFWSHLERAAAFAQLGLDLAASDELSKADALNPKFLSDPVYFLSRYITNPDASAHVLEGLERAGLRRLQ
ncbi:hypothetical protein [Tropicibacter sp. Alg240-R139]|uniref:tetratricopeptide repeat protein n=1 Tax=Tropicibacter sp. Alg240-R139 TaxID=2305991 RepID=UPI0013E06EB5|nr:hypothetical protein [Tropicibacter sp. Alg240-R139]